MLLLPEEILVYVTKIGAVLLLNNFDLLFLLATGLVGAACGQLDALLKKGSARRCRMSNGSSPIKAHFYENATTLTNGTLDGIYCNGNGLHV